MAAGSIRLDRGPMRFLLAQEPIVVASAGIRGAKTHTGAIKDLTYALEHPTAEDEYHVVASPTFEMSKVPVEKFFRLLYDTSIFPVSPLLRYWKHDRVFLLAANGGTSRIKVVSAHDPDRWRGFKWRSAWLDEAAYMSSYAWEVAQGRLIDTAGPAWLTTTPRGYNWLFDLYVRAKTDPTIRFIHWRTQDNSHIRTERLADYVKNLDAKTAAQETGALFMQEGGTVYHAFDEGRNVAPGRLNPERELFVGVDFNVNPMSAVLFQPFTTREGLEGIHGIAEKYIDDGDTFKLMTWLVEFCKTNRLPRSRVTVYPDASGRARSTSGKSDLQIIRDAGFAVRAPRTNPPIRDRVNCVNGLLAPLLLRFPRLVIDPSLVVLINALKHQKRDPKTSLPDKEHGLDHPNDALGYLCHERYPLRLEGGLAA